MNDELGRLYEELGEWNRSLEVRVADQVKELRASRAGCHRGHAERRRIERDLHDGAQQHLASAVHLRLARDLADSEPAKAMEMLDSLGDVVQDALEELRDLAHGIYPPLLGSRSRRGPRRGRGTCDDSRACRRRGNRALRAGRQGDRLFLFSRRYGCREVQATPRSQRYGFARRRAD